MTRPRNVTVTLPGYDGQRELVSAMVDSPYAKGERERVVMNARESALESLHAKGKLGPAQKRAGDRYRALCELMALRNGAVDTSNEPVDVCGISDPIPDRVIDAGKQLKAAAARLTTQEVVLMDAVCRFGRSTTEIAGMHSGHREPTKQQTRVVLARLRKALDKLARHWCYA